MKIKESVQFKEELAIIAHTIKRDKQSASINFVLNLKSSIINLLDSPYMCRKSIYYSNIEIRDMVYHGYTIIYEIKEEKNLLIVLTIFNQNLPDIDCGEII